METAQIVALKVVPPSRPTVRIEDDTVVVDRLRVTDRELAAFVDQRPADDRPDLAVRALRIGLLALQDAGTHLDVDFVRHEFDELLARNADMNRRATETVDQVLRQNFGDGDGRLPQMLERFLGDRGQLSRFVSELFDESKRDSAIGRMRTLLGGYFDGDASKLAQLLDPTRMGSPLHQFRTEVTDQFEKLNERLTQMEATFIARGAERAKSAAKGTDFEGVLEQMLGEVARATGDTLENTASGAGDVMRSKKGDFVLTVDPQSCEGCDVRVVIEAKDRNMSWRELREELAAAKLNRSAQMAMVVFTPQHAPAGVAPFDVRAGHVVCVIDPDAPDATTLASAVRLARLYAIASLERKADTIDVRRVSQAVAAVRGELDAVRALKTQLTAIGRTASEVSGGLDRMRENVLSKVADAEAYLRVGPAGRD